MSVVASHSTSALTRIENIARAILVLRGHRVLLDAELAALYGVTTTRLNQQVRRNRQRFPTDFLFELTAEEFSSLMLQNATSKRGRGGRRKLPLAFTEHGAIMAATVPASASPPISERTATGSAWTRLRGCATTRRRRSGV